MDSIAIDFYRAIHYSALCICKARSCHRMSSVCPSVCLWRWWIVIALEILETNSTHRRRSSVNFGRQDIFARKLCTKKLTKCSNCTWYLPEKNIKMPEFLWYLPEQLTKFPNFTWYLPENAGILRDNYPKINYIFENFIGEGHVGCPPYPTPMIALTSIYSYVMQCIDLIWTMNRYLSLFMWSKTNSKGDNLRWSGS